MKNHNHNKPILTVAIKMTLYQSTGIGIFQAENSLTNLSQASHKRDISKQQNAASDQGLHCLH